MTARRAWAASVAIGISAGMVVAAAMMYIAWQHNPQGAFREPERVHWGDWLTVGLSWFFVIAVGVGLATRLLIGALAPDAATTGRNRGAAL